LRIVLTDFHFIYLRPGEFSDCVHFFLGMQFVF
jgi:hypothetical protein